MEVCCGFIWSLNVALISSEVINFDEDDFILLKMTSQNLKPAQIKRGEFSEVFH